MKMKVKENKLNDLAKDFLNNLGNKNTVCLYGNLGTGKTSFVKSVAKNLGVQEEVTSPTFTIQKTYKLSHKKYKQLIHIDLYRIENPKEIEILKLEETVKDKNNLVFIEWAEKIDSHLEDPFVRVNIFYLDENSRDFEITL